MSLFSRYIEKETLIITDGHFSNLEAVHSNGCYHQIVNHSRNLKTIDGFHTNNIENLWSLLKYERTKRRGILKSSLDIFLCEFKFRYLFLKENTSEQIKNAFNRIVEIFVSPSRLWANRIQKKIFFTPSSDTKKIFNI